MQLTAHQVAALWVEAGGAPKRATEWTAIALGESSYNTDVVSSAGAIGLWQIMPFNAAPNGYSVADMYNAYDNARVAVKMSGGGMNCAPWDSCYADIQKSGRYSFLGWPEPGSADYNNLAVVSSELGTDKIGGAMPPPGALQVSALHRASAHLDAQLQGIIRTVTKQLVWQRMELDSLGTNGWIP